MSEDTQSAPKAGQPKNAVAPAGELKSPREWALVTGNGPNPKSPNKWSGKGFSGPKGSAKHEAAKMLHGWDDHEYETSKPIQLTRADYEAALDASHPEEGNPVAHPAALSPYKGKRGLLRVGQKPEAVKS